MDENSGLDTRQLLWQITDGCLSSGDQDHFSEVLFHVSSITNLKKQDKRRFSIYFRKKHYDFMAHSEGKIKKKKERGTLYLLLVFPHDLFIHQRFTTAGSGLSWHLEGSQVLPHQNSTDK